jgi:hypothetical protein
MKILVAIILSVFLSILLTPFLLAQPADPAPPANWEDPDAGTAGNPYQVASLDNLYWIAADDVVVPSPVRAVRWASHYFQTTDIDASDTQNWGADLEKGWTPIGLSEGSPFSGTYDGNGNTIDGVYIYRYEEDYQGLFGFTSGAACTVKNLGVTNVDILGRWHVGALAGRNHNYATIDNCYSSGEVKGRPNRWYIGGLTGSNSFHSTIKNSHSSADVNGPRYVGGLVGYQWESASIINCYSTGNVSGGKHTGGLVGSSWDAFTLISNSYSTGNVTSTSDEVGGLVGSNNSGSAIKNCFSTGNVHAFAYPGGLVGRNNQGIIEYSFSMGAVTGSGPGGLVGWKTTGGAYSDLQNYWDAEASGVPTSDMGFGKDTEEMTYPYDAGTYVGWDFDDIWRVDHTYSMNDGYPYLRGLAFVPLSGLTWTFEEDIDIFHNSANQVGFDPNPVLPGGLPELIDIFAFSVTGEGVVQFTVHTDAALGYYYQNGSWSSSISNAEGLIIYNIDFAALRSPEVILYGGNDEIDDPLPVTLSSFTASPTANSFVELQWITETETNLLGYHLLRSQEDELATAGRITSSVIEAFNSSSATEYRFLDEEVLTGNTYYYWIQAIDLDLSTAFFGPVSITLAEEDDTDSVPDIYTTHLIGAYPNPFNPGTNISFSLAEESEVTIIVYNSRGQKIRSLSADQTYPKGFNSVSWNGKDYRGNEVSSGVYLYKMSVSNRYESSKKMMLIK